MNSHQKIKSAQEKIEFAELLMNNSSYEKAIRLFEEAKKLFGEKNPEYYVKCSILIAKGYYELGKYDLATQNIKSVSAMQKEILKKDDLINSISLELQGDICRIRTEYKKAIKFYEDSTQIREKNNDIKNLLNNYNVLVELYEKENEDDKSKQYQEKIYSLVSTMLNEDKEEIRKTISKIVDNLKTQLEKLQKDSIEQVAEIERLKKLEYLSAMATGISHSINNPVGILRLAAQRGLRELARNNLTPEKATEIFEKILTQLDRLHHITSGFRKFATGDRSTIESVDLNALAQQMQEYFTNQLNEHKINLILELSPTPPHCQANSFILQEALINLINNAREALESEKIPDATIWLKTYQHAEKVGIIVEDNGKGIAESLQSTLFAPFHSSKAHGMGLGLYFAHKSLAEIKGTLSYQTRSPNGASFTIEFNGEKHEN